MSIFKRKKASEEVYEYIEEHLDNDIELLRNSRPIDMGGKQIPLFDEDKVFINIMSEICTRRSSAFIKVVSYAASVIVLLGLGIATYQYSRYEEPAIREIYAQRGDKTIVVLPDGSVAQLNSDTKLFYPENFTSSRREVKIEGEAYFEVKKDKDRPFVVKAFDMMVKVTGTKFNIKAYPEDRKITTTLEEGKILVGKNKRKSALTEMSPGDCAEFEKGTDRFTIHRPKYFRDAYSWKNNNLRFRDTQLNQLLITLERKFDVRFIVTDSKIYSYTYNINASATDLGEIIAIMETITPVKFHKTGTGVYEIRTK